MHDNATTIAVVHSELEFNGLPRNRRTAAATAILGHFGLQD